MDVETTIKNSLLMHPTVEHNRLSVLNHLFLVIGNGYEWKKGELVEVGKRKGNATIEKAILKIVTSNLAKDNLRTWFDVGELLGNGHGENEDYAFDFLSERLTNDIKNSIILTFDIENRMKDMTPYSDLKKFPFTFYPICEYSELCNLPKDIKPDWLAAAKEIYEFVVANPQLIREEDKAAYNEWLPKAKERINELEKV